MTFITVAFLHDSHLRRFGPSGLCIRRIAAFDSWSDAKFITFIVFQRADHYFVPPAG